MKWISVKDALPEPAQMVIVGFLNQTLAGPVPEFNCTGGDFLRFVVERQKDDSPAWWMPLPPLPTGEEDKVEPNFSAAAPDLRQANAAAIQCIVDFLECYKNDCARVVMDEAVKSLKNDALPKLRAAIAKSEGELAKTQLIAAPDLLVSLIWATDMFEDCIAQGNGEIEGDREGIAKARAAIAKAKGETL